MRSCRPERRRLIHHHTPPPPAATISRNHSNQLVPVSDVGAGTGVDDLLGVGGAELGALADSLVRELGEAGVSVRLAEAPGGVAVAFAFAVTVAAAVVVVVTLEEAAVLVGAGFDADSDEDVGFVPVGGGTLGLSVRVGELVSVGVPSLDGVFAVGSVTLGPSDRVGVGSPEPSPPEPHPERATSVMTAPAITALRIAPPPPSRTAIACAAR